MIIYSRIVAALHRLRIGGIECIVEVVGSVELLSAHVVRHFLQIFAHCLEFFQVGFAYHVELSIFLSLFQSEKSAGIGIGGVRHFLLAHA